MIADFHNDFIYKSLYAPDSEFQSCLQQLLDGDVMFQVYAILFTSSQKDDVLSIYEKSLSFFNDFINKNNEHIGIAKTYVDFEKNVAKNKISAVLSLEDSQILFHHQDNLKKFYNDGVRFATLLWDGENSIGFSYKENQGLKKEGIELIKKIEYQNIVLDISHLSDKGVEDVFTHTKSVVVASHSNVRALTNHRRNLTDRQIKKIVDRNGIIGINFFPKYVDINEISEKSVSTLHSIVSHLSYLKNIAGEDAICLGADFDGMSSQVLKYLTYRNAADYQKFAYDLSKHFPESFVEKILYKNLISFYKENFGSEYYD